MSNIVFLYHPAPLLPGGGDHRQRLFIHHSLYWHNQYWFTGSSVHGLQGELKKNRKIHILIVSSERLTWSDRPTHGACSAQLHVAWFISHV